MPGLPAFFFFPQPPEQVMSLRPFTIAGRRDGFGAQIYAQMSGVAFAAASGREYRHTPMAFVAHAEQHTPGALDALGGVGSACSAADPADPLEQQLPCIPEVWHAERPDTFFSPEVLALLRSRYSGSGAKPAAPACLHGAAERVVVHVRRGDVTAFRNNDRHTPVSVYVSVVVRLRRLHPRATIVVYSEGPPGELECLARLPSVRLCLDTDLPTTFHAMTQVRSRYIYI